VETVDECTDIDACEFIELPPGGIMWTGPAIGVPLERRASSDEDEDDPQFPDFPWERASFSEMWFEYLYGYNTEQAWVPFIPNAPQDPDPPPRLRPMAPGQVIPMKGRKRG
jgi:hypothetical protein